MNIEFPFRYHAFGLNIRSELELPPLIPVDNIARADVTIRLDHISTSGLEHAETATPFFQCARDQLWLNVPEIARFLVVAGNSITVAPATDADRQSIRLFLLGSCLGAILHQRGMLVLHGNAIRFGDHCVAFVGASGQGKSTLAAAFHKRGHDILTDDVCAIDKQGRVLPGYPQMKLWHDTLAKLDVDKSGLKKVRLQVEKFAYPVPKGFSKTPLPVRAIYILNTHNRDEFLFDPLKGMEKFQPLRYQTYRKGYLKGLALNALHLQLCGRIAGEVHMARITRPDHGFQLDALVERIQDDLEKQGLAQ